MSATIVSAATAPSTPLRACFDIVTARRISMTEVRYREGVPSDANDIIDFQIAMARETEDFELQRDITTRGVHAVFADPSLGRYFVAESLPGVNARVVASLMITYEWSDWRNGVVWWIQSVYVVPDFRRRGIYAGLYKHVKNIAENNESV